MDNFSYLIILSFALSEFWLNLGLVKRRDNGATLQGL